MDTEIMSMARRPIPWSPDLSIDKDGVLYNSGKIVPTTIKRSRFKLEQLAIIIDGEYLEVWRLLSFIWYDKGIIVPRDSNAMQWHHENVIQLKKLTFTNIYPAIVDPDEILFIWKKYSAGASCADMSKATGLSGYSVDQYYNLIGDILQASIRR